MTPPGEPTHADAMLDRLARRAVALSPPMAEAELHELISFGSGDASPAVLPDMTESAAIALSRYRSETLQYGPRMGLPALREWLCGYLREDGVSASPDEVIVINGAKHGLDLVCRLLLDEGDSVVVTAPTYFTAFQSFAAMAPSSWKSHKTPKGSTSRSCAPFWRDSSERGVPFRSSSTTYLISTTRPESP